MIDRFTFNDNGACLIIHDNVTGINRASCYSSGDAVAICDALDRMEILNDPCYQLYMGESDYRYISKLPL